MESNNVWMKFLMVALVFALFIANIPMKNVSAVEKKLSEKEAVAIMEAVSRSSVTNEDGTVFVNEEQLKKELKGNRKYTEIKKELKELGLLTNDPIEEKVSSNSSKASMMAAASSSQINPKWKAVRDACAKKYIQNKYGLTGVAAIVAALLEGDFKKGLRLLLTKGASLTLAGLLTTYGHMNYKCIKLANSKHRVYK